MSSPSWEEMYDSMVLSRDRAIAMQDSLERALAVEERQHGETIKRLKAVAAERDDAARLREALPVLLKWIDNLALFAANHGFNKPVPELVEAVAIASAVLGETKP